jgi:putative addiction module component (TIGR02574 family)
MESLDTHIDEDVEAAWAKEIARRLEDVDSGKVAAVPWAEARRRILAASDPKPSPRGDVSTSLTA